MNKKSTSKKRPVVARKVEQVVQHGDYVLATKYPDGDPQDHWAIGFYAGITAPHYNPPRYDVVDADGRQFRGNGFRRFKKISKKRGAWMLQNAKDIERSCKSVWWWARASMSNDGLEPRGNRVGSEPLLGIGGKEGEQ